MCESFCIIFPFFLFHSSAHSFIHSFYGKGPQILKKEKRSEIDENFEGGERKCIQKWDKLD